MTNAHNHSQLISLLDLNTSKCKLIPFHWTAQTTWACKANEKTKCGSRKKVWSARAPRRKRIENPICTKRKFKQRAQAPVKLRPRQHSAAAMSGQNICHLQELVSKITDEINTMSAIHVIGTIEQHSTYRPRNCLGSWHYLTKEKHLKQQKDAFPVSMMADELCTSIQDAILRSMLQPEGQILTK